jgi:GNAT superfamily N-acetyltransferase
MVYTDPNLRGYGLGKQLVKYAMECMRKEASWSHTDGVWMQINHDNIGMEKVASSLGFRNLGSFGKPGVNVWYRR